MSENLYGLLNVAKSNYEGGGGKEYQGDLPIVVDNDNNKIQLRYDDETLTLKDNELSVKSVGPSPGSGVSQIKAGENITLEPESGTGVVKIHANKGTGDPYTAGDGLSLDDNCFSIDKSRTLFSQCSKEETYKTATLYTVYCKAFTVDDMETETSAIITIDNDVGEEWCYNVCAIKRLNDRNLLVEGVMRDYKDGPIKARVWGNLAKGNEVTLSIMKWALYSYTPTNPEDSHSISDIMRYKNIYIDIPKKLYYVGDELDLSNAHVYMSFKIDDYYEISVDDCNIYVVGGMDTPGKKQLICEYTDTEKDTTYKYTVEITIQRVANSIKISKLPKVTEFYEPALINHNGLAVVAEYDDGTEDVITDYKINLFDNTSNENEYIYQVEYQGKFAYYTINIIEKKEIGLMVTISRTNPNEVEAYVRYSDGSVRLLDASEYDEYEIPLNEYTKSDTIKRIQIKYKEFTEVINIPRVV